MELERRSFPAELRAEKDHGKTYLVGRAASYGVLSMDLGGWYEILQPGCFDSALAAGTDIVHKLNHSDDLVLGRTGTGSTVLTSKPDGLYYKTLLPMTSYVRDMIVLMERGDFNESSFAFEIGDGNDTWDTMPDPENPKRMVILRTITGCKRLWDVATCYMGAYPKTDAQLSDRMLPASMPAEYRAMLGGDVPYVRNSRHMRATDNDEDDDQTDCTCTCPECEDDDCANCSNPDCTDENCLAAIRVRFYEVNLRLENHGGIAQRVHNVETEDDRVARERKLKLAMANW